MLVALPVTGEHLELVGETVVYADLSVSYSNVRAGGHDVAAGAVIEYAAGARLGRFERIVGSDRVPHTAEPALRNDVAGRACVRGCRRRRFRRRARIVDLVGVGAEVAPACGGGTV